MLKARFNFKCDVPDDEQTTLEASHVSLISLVKLHFVCRKRLHKLNFGAMEKASTAMRNVD